MELRFGKLKFGTGLFYKNVDSIVRVDGANISVSIPKYLYYCNNFTLVLKHSEDYEKETFVAVKNMPDYDVANDVGLEMAKMLNLIHTIKIYKGFRKIIVVDSNYDGVILKN